MPTYRTTLEYAGTRFAGWQEQPSERTVAGTLRAACAEVGLDVLDLGGAGRTDAGVHALGQVAHLRLRASIDPERTRRELNAVLPSDIHLLAIEPAAATFDARRDAIERTYLYQITRRRSAFAHRQSWWVKRRIEVAAMADAATLLTGRHDFAAFCERPAEQTSTLVEVHDVEVAEDGALVLIRIAASHFLWKMTRRVVGALVRVGAGEWSAADLAALLGGGRLPAAKGTVAEGTAPPSGLFLESVYYPGDPPPGPMRPTCSVTPESAIAVKRPRSGRH